MALVYLSHAPADQKTANRVREFLEGQGITCWSAPRLGSPAPVDSETNARGIRSSAAFLLLFSRDANESKSVQGETALALESEKTLISLRIEDVSPTGFWETFFQKHSCHDAFSPPLERHLEQIIRLLKPLVAKRLSDATQEAIFSRTLPSRASVVRSSAGGKTGIRESTGPIHLSLRMDHPLISNHPSTFELRIQNEGLENLRDVEVVLESRNLKRAITHQWPGIGVEKKENVRLEMEPFRSGESVLHVTVTCRAGDSRRTYAGSRLLRINAIPSAQELSAGPGWLWDYFHRAGVSLASKDGPLFASLQDLLKTELPAQAETLGLILEHEVSVQSAERAAASGSLEIPAAFLNLMREGTRLVLEPVKTLATVPHQEIRLVAGTVFNLGRSPEETDFLLWFWPRNEVHDTKTRRISKKHCSLVVQGGKINVVNMASASLTTFDSEDLTGPHGVLLEQRGTLNFSGIYFLDVMRFPPHRPHGPAISNLDSWVGGRNKREPSTPGGSVRFLPLTPHVLPQHSSWLLSDGAFGSSRANPIILDFHGLDEIQGRFYHHLGCFWLENLVDNDAVQIGDQIVRPGSIIPLTNGQMVKFGERQFQVMITA